VYESGNKRIIPIGAIFVQIVIDSLRNLEIAVNRQPYLDEYAPIEIILFIFRDGR
jgi:hypothetical protein